eukprot:jgi/Chlat1/5214/Chrsp33S05049
MEEASPVSTASTSSRSSSASGSGSASTSSTGSGTGGRSRVVVVTRMKLSPHAFKKWKKLYDESDYIRLQYGCLEPQGSIFRTPTNRDCLAIIEHWKSAECLEAYMKAETFKFSKYIEGPIRWSFSPHPSVAEMPVSTAQDMFSQRRWNGGASAEEIDSASP